MKIAFSTNAFTLFSIDDAVAKIGEIGYQGVEILADRPHLNPLEPGNNIIGMIRKNLDRFNMGVSNINANTASSYFNHAFIEPMFEPSLSNQDKELRDWRIKYTKEAINIAGELGAKNISITSGRILPDCPPESGIENFKRSLDEILPYAERRNIAIGIEYEPGLLIESAEETLDLIKEFRSSYLGVNLDIGHAIVSGEDTSKIIRDLSPWILNIHIEDIKNRKHYHLIPGEGDIDIPGIIKGLNEINYEGYLTVELYTYYKSPEIAAEKALKYLINLI